MAAHARVFDREKALETILLIAKHLNTPTLHSVSKILYLADKRHLQDFGRLTCGDKYIAMEYGPVPSGVYDMMKVAGDRHRIDPDWDEVIKDAFEVRGGRRIKLKRQPDTALLAESEIDCIKKTIIKYGKKSFGQLTDITHDEAWRKTAEARPIPLEAIAKTLSNAEEVVAYLRTR